MIACYGTLRKIVVALVESFVQSRGHQHWLPSSCAPFVLLEEQAVLADKTGTIDEEM